MAAVDIQREKSKWRRGVEDGSSGGGGGGAFATAYQQFEYQFDTNTAQGDPGVGLLRFNNATPSNVTFLYIDDESQLGQDLDANVFPLVVAGNRVQIRTTDYGTNEIFRLTGAPVDFAGFWRIPVVHESGNMVLGVHLIYRKSFLLQNVLRQISSAKISTFPKDDPSSVLQRLVQIFNTANLSSFDLALLKVGRY